MVVLLWIDLADGDKRQREEVECGSCLIPLLFPEGETHIGNVERDKRYAFLVGLIPKNSISVAIMIVRIIKSC